MCYNTSAAASFCTFYNKHGFADLNDASITDTYFGEENETPLFYRAPSNGRVSCFCATYMSPHTKWDTSLLSSNKTKTKAFT